MGQGGISLLSPFIYFALSLVACFFGHDILGVAGDKATNLGPLGILAPLVEREGLHAVRAAVELVAGHLGQDVPLRLGRPRVAPRMISGPKR